MRKFLPLLLLALLLFSALAFRSSGQSPKPRATAAKPSTSTVCCPGNTTLPRDKRTPEACAKASFAEYGHPVMFPSRLDISYGVSQSRSKPSVVYIWMDNQTDVWQTHYVCCQGTFIDFFELYDGDGNRVPMKDPALEKERATGAETAWACGCSGGVSVPPHMLKMIDGGDLTYIYVLPPGRYTIVERAPALPYAATPPAPSPTLPDSGPRLGLCIL
jgi:hypothetical protein